MESAASSLKTVGLWKFILWSAVIVAVGIIGAAPAATAQETKDNFPDMPTLNIFTREELQRDFLRMQFAKPADRPDLGFVLAIPKTWDEVPMTIPLEELKHDDQSTIPLAALKGPEKDVQIEIAYCRVPETVELEEWARAYLEGNGLEVVHVQTGDFSGRHVFDTLLNAPEGLRFRMAFSRHGDKIYIVGGSAPASLYEKYMKVFGLAVLSFRKL
jgi:hypothetical protein